jgi:hypothetical protein
MKTFFFTTLFRLLAITGWWIYLSSFQSEILYNTLGVMNPSTQAVATCMSGVDSLSGVLNMKLDTILQEIQQQSNSTTGTLVSPFAITETSTNTGNVRVIENLVLPTTATGN